jgi:fructokinase
VAVAAARLGAEVGFASQVSNDLFGTYIRQVMRDNGIDGAFVLESGAPSTLAFVEETEGEAHFSFVANGAADTRYDPRPRPAFPAEVAFVQFGSISLLAEPAASAITEIVTAHRERCTIVLDPNVRPALIDSRERYLEKLRRWLALAHVVKVSVQDLAWLYPETEALAAARSWLELGPAAVIVTRGEKGASLLRSGKADLEAPAPRVSVVDTVGAGDTFTGALMVALLERNGREVASTSDALWDEALRYAAAAAALNCTRSGAQPPRRDELAAFPAEGA